MEKNDRKIILDGILNCINTVSEIANVIPLFCGGCDWVIETKIADGGRRKIGIKVSQSHTISTPSPKMLEKMQQIKTQLNLDKFYLLTIGVSDVFNFEELRNFLGSKQEKRWRFKVLDRVVLQIFQRYHGGNLPCH